MKGDDVLTSVSRHAKKRVRQRVGIPGRSAKRLADNVWEKGLKYNDLGGELKKYVYDKVVKAGNIPRVYGQFLYLFSTDGTLCTAFNLPSRLHSLAKICSDKKRE